MKKIIILIYLCSIAAFSFAQENTKNLDEVIVKEKRKTAKERSEFKRHAQTVEALTEEELNRNNPAFIEQSLGTMAGVQVDKRTQLGGQRIVIRGYGNDQKFNNWGIKAYYNGIPISTADGVTILDDIDFSSVNNIEVIKGPAATMYGGGVGGVARFYLKPSDEKGVSLTEKAVVGSFGLLQSNTRIDIVNDSSAMFLSYGHLQSNGYRPRGNSLKNNLTYMGEFKLTKKQTIIAYLSHNYSHEGVTGQISYADYYAGIDNGNPAYAKKNARNDILATRFALTHQYAFSNKFSNNTSIFYSNQDFKRVAAGADESSLNPNFGLRSVFNIKSKVNENSNNELNIGTEIQQSRSLISNYRFLGTDDANPLKVQDISKGSYFKYITNQNSFFVHNRTNFNKYDLALILGVSANHLDYNRTDLLAPLGLVTGYNKDLSFTKSFTTSINPHIALQKTIKKQIINLSYSEGYNAPTASTAFIGTINKANDDLLPEKARMWDLGMQGLLLNNKLDYQVSLFNIDITNKLTQLSGVIPTGGTYTYFANTGNQRNRGLELSLGYLIIPGNGEGVIKKIEPFLNLSSYNFRYTDFKTKFGSNIVDYSDKNVVGVPKTKYTAGLDIVLKSGLYLNNTFNFMGDVYTDFANANKVKSYSLLNSKLGYRHVTPKVDFDIYFAGNNLTNQVNYTFLFLGNNISDVDPGNGYPANVTTDVNPGPSKAYYFGGITVKYKF
ncbi:Vitamin B12 transporter BtuB [Emticicia aquatica]|uniref:Vitamin B12 transporter BtuB n=1 Tax=Emticicia aquatica TaxID=1681835 RepID=A0ABN8ETM9_9BACT|nr:TonB-dependent receptor [Emticicia aquatica]CAH0995123.1 Vitamin B12 transporter BtuB [Emticicia aquatica]